ncbi:hypothetical protein [Rubrobacter indicoceani]|uniref:hypothetical protein n=1 Tax=Rubrobacter indicoceani TaxID=2051957 RepID=UPI000E5B35BA|nr:hypothetical protein [Rubrobacter indicoceani]
MEPQGVFRTERIPSLSRIPKEVGRERRSCELCGVTGEHIYYLVPRKVAFLYFKHHSKNLHATCLSCGGSTVVTGPERDHILSGSRSE